MRKTSLLIFVLLLTPITAHTKQRVAESLSDWAFFGQTGWAESDVSSYAIGAQHALPWRGEFLGTYWHSYMEVTVASWVADEPGSARSNRFTQFGVSPVLRLQHPGRLPGLFVDIGVGAYLIAPIYRHRDKRFGSAYNFGDQIGVGFAFGHRRNHEVSLRVQHFSNAGIKRPNPGEDFLQVRLLLRFAD